ncbi:cysteine hydrolase [Bifidobacterium sp. SO4]|uniref:cysteine hydrolase family protein n=1 Tax=Bifidobacterium sp. SO4 TaxID=2809030 RepID=UPI001BDC7813|nr:cysteine hydrolase [Bifidobacterium sp. SO4]MBT1170682.1 cysteine hydrolase [Bifidobacterium sp. SO4]
MHKTIIDESVRAGYRALKGNREYAFTDIDPKRTAHLIVDMQNGFLEPGALLETPSARDIVANVNAISGAIRSHGGLNVFLRFTTSTTSAWSCYFERFQDPDFGEKEVADFLPGTHWHDLYLGIDVREEKGDVILDKTRFSAFVGDSSDALRVLKEHGIDTVIVSGTLTSCCSASTARDAQQLGFRVIVAEDANADVSDFAHNCAINNLAAWFADIRSTEEVIRLLNADIG